MKQIDQMKKTGKTCSYFFAIIMKECPSAYLLYLLDIIIKIAGIYVPVKLLQLLVDSVTDPAVLVKAAIMLVLSNGFLAMAGSIMNSSKDICRDRLNRRCQTALSQKVMELSYDKIESSAILEQLQKAKTGISWYSGGPAGIMGTCAGLIVSIISFFIGSYITLSRVPILGVFIIIYTAVTAILNKKMNEVELQYYDRTSKINRIFTYLYEELGEHKYIKENRLFAGTSLIADKVRSFNQDLTGLWREESQTKLKYAMPCSVLAVVRDVIYYLYLGAQAIRRQITLGEFTLLLSVCGQVTQDLCNISDRILDLNKRCNYAGEYCKFMEIENHTENQNGISQTIPRSSADITIEFDHVSFHYPGSENMVLKDVTLLLRGGKSIAVVGENGAGKSTLIKLLCGLYPDYEGIIRVNGINIREYSSEQYKQLFATVFQDFKLFACDLDENICFLQDTVEVEPKLLNCLEKVGMLSKLRNLTDGVHTPVYKNFDKSGFEPSGGETQKIAIARALYRESDIYIMDEANAALDPEMESELNHLFQELFNGKLSITITHRLASCKDCDQIVVLHQGEIVENGTPTELMGIPEGYYRTMFMAQKNMFWGIQ